MTHSLCSMMALKVPADTRAYFDGIVLAGSGDFKRWLEPMNRGLWNAFQNRNGQEVPYSFSFKLGNELSTSDKKWLGDALPHMASVYCCVKSFMNSPNLSQAPIQVLPAGCADKVRLHSELHATLQQARCQFFQIHMPPQGYQLWECDQCMTVTVAPMAPSPGNGSQHPGPCGS